MFGYVGDMFSFNGGDIAFVVLVLILDVACLYYARTFFKKI